jgi:HlyD family secretion protein
MRTVMRRLGVAAVIALAGGLLVVALRAPAVRVEVAAVERGTLRVTVDEEGRTRVRDRYLAVAPITGRVARITLDAGDAVERGMVVARMRPVTLDPRTRVGAEARLESALAAAREAEARLDQARAAAEQARRDATRARELARSRIVARGERERAELSETARAKELDAAISGLRAAEQNVEAARAALIAPGGDAGESFSASCEERPESCIEVRSPVSGKVLRVPEQSERVVDAGAPLLEIGDPSALEIVIDVLSSDAVKVQSGAAMLIEEWGGPRPLRARVRLVEPSGFTKVSALGVEEQRVNVIGDFLDADVPLADGYRVEARIVVWERADVLKVPTSALFRYRDAWHVFVAENGRARRSAVEVGERSAIAAEVLGGIAAGEVVILHPSDQVDDGVRIATVGELAPSGIGEGRIPVPANRRMSGPVRTRTEFGKQFGGT